MEKKNRQYVMLSDGQAFEALGNCKLVTLSPRAEEALRAANKDGEIADIEDISDMVEVLHAAGCQEADDFIERPLWEAIEPPPGAPQWHRESSIPIGHVFDADIKVLLTHALPSVPGSGMLDGSVVLCEGPDFYATWIGVEDRDYQGDRLRKSRMDGDYFSFKGPGRPDKASALFKATQSFWDRARRFDIKETK